MITLKKGQYLSNVMDNIPSNCILSKRIPGCGATTLELETSRNSIIIVPNVPVIISKSKKYSNLLGVYEGVSQHKMMTYLKENKTRKIMTTPESFNKIKQVCNKCGINICTEFFLLMDECHQLIKDVDYRPDVVMPMNDFFLFKDKALVSATPIGFSDPRFKENQFKTIEVTADYDYRQEITVTHTYNIAKSVGDYLKEHDGIICFFINSVVVIYSIIKQFDLLEDSTIYTAPKSKGNLKKEYNFRNAYTKWSAKTMKKFNFFTGRFFTAFDLDLDYKPDLVMITDPFVTEHSILDVDTDCIQICGRFRNGINSATHIYRAHPDITVKTKEQIEWEISAHEFAYKTIETLYNSADNKESRFAFGTALETLPFRKFQYEDFTKNWFAIDNEINEVLVNGRYHTRINDWYNDCHFFNPIFRNCKYDENSEKLKIINKARSVKGKRKEMVEMLAELEEPSSEYALDFINDMRKIDSFIVEAWESLGSTRIMELNYNQKKIKEEMILNQLKGNRTVQLIKNSFCINKVYLNDKIVDELNRIFSLLNIHPEKEIKPNMIQDYYQAVPVKSNGKRGFRLISELL